MNEDERKCQDSRACQNDPPGYPRSHSPSPPLFLLIPRLASPTSRVTSRMLHLSLLVSSALLLGADASTCGTPRLSCSAADTSSPDPCCQPHPGGLFVFKQRFDPDIGDAGAWGIEGLDVLSCIWLS